MAEGTPAATPAARIASAMPGAWRSSTASVASGVPSVGESPVPPVVSTTAGRVSSASRRAASTSGPSGTTTGSAASNPHSRSAWVTSGPPRSS